MYNNKQKIAPSVLFFPVLLCLFLFAGTRKRINAAGNVAHRLNREVDPSLVVPTTCGSGSGNGNRSRGRFAAARFKHRKVIRHPLRAYAPLAQRASRLAQFCSKRIVCESRANGKT